jgi:AhpD family alkylhydroperoxidase
MRPNARTNVYTAWLNGYRAFDTFSTAVLASGLDQTLVYLILIRASQINGCTYCCDMHTRDAQRAGEDQRRLHTIVAWRDAPWFNDQERAVLALTEAVTRLDSGDIPDHIVDETVRLCGEEGTAKVLWTIVAINGWNRMNVTARLAPPDSSGRRATGSIGH